MPELVDSSSGALALVSDYETSESGEDTDSVSEVEQSVLDEEL